MSAWLIIVPVSLTIFALAFIVILTAGGRNSKRIHSRLAALDKEFAPVVFEDQTADIRKERERMSTIPWLNSWLTKLNLAAASSLFLYQAGVTATVGSLLLMSLAGAAFAGYLVYLRTDGILPALLVIGILLPAPFWFVRTKRARRLSTLEQQLPEALSMMASALRVGHSLVASLGAVAQESPEPIGGEMRKCFDEQNYGIDLRTTLINLTRRTPVQDFRIFVAAVLIQKESGGNLAEVLEKVAQTARERFRLKKQVSVHTAQGRMTGWILSLLPVLIGFFMYLMNPDGMSVLWKREIGLKMLYGATAMDVIGTAIIRKVVSIRV